MRRIVVSLLSVAPFRTDAGPYPGIDARGLSPVGTPHVPGRQPRARLARPSSHLVANALLVGPAL